MERVAGAPIYATANPRGFATQVAAELATLHTITLATHDLRGVTSQATRLMRVLQPPVTLDETLQEGRIRVALAAMNAHQRLVQPAPNHAASLLHGDFWPGNLLWQGDQLVAIIDWEDAEVGHALADVAVTRLDLLWLFGEKAMASFTATYHARSGRDLTNLPLWDLVAALRPAGRLAEYAADWPQLGRPDITETTLRAGHARFIEAALAALGPA
jgi:aminoglycoside phosphotransferase (APT) family kinase protein